MSLPLAAMCLTPIDVSVLLLQTRFGVENVFSYPPSERHKVISLAEDEQRKFEALRDECKELELVAGAFFSSACG